MYNLIYNAICMFAMSVVAVAFVSQGDESAMTPSIKRWLAPHSVPRPANERPELPTPGTRSSWAKLHNLGIALAKSGKLQESTGQLRQALAVKPDEVETWLALAGLYQSNGDLHQAVSIANEYLKRYPNTNDGRKISEYMKYLRSEEKTLSSNNRSSYIKGNDKLASWLADRMPLRVYLHTEELTATDRVMLPVVHDAFDKWTQISHGKIRFKFVSSPETSDIECFLTGKSKNLHRTFAAGETRWRLTDSGSLRASVFLLTEINEEPATPSRLYWLSLHEIGHSLGLQHSPDPKDIMFISMPIKDDWRIPSRRDEVSLQKLYKVPAAVASR